MTELPNDYERRALAFRLLSSLAHETEQNRFQQTLDDAMKDPNLREAVAYLPGTESTYSALAQYIPEDRTAWLHTHERPGDPAKKLTAALSVRTYRSRGRGTRPAARPHCGSTGLHGNRPKLSASYMQPYPGHETP
jgi:hypothetical protein